MSEQVAALISLMSLMAEQEHISDPSRTICQMSQHVRAHARLVREQKSEVHVGRHVSQNMPEHTPQRTSEHSPKHSPACMIDDMSEHVRAHTRPDARTSARTLCQ